MQYQENAGAILDDTYRRRPATAKLRAENLGILLKEQFKALQPCHSKKSQSSRIVISALSVARFILTWPCVLSCSTLKFLNAVVHVGLCAGAESGDGRRQSETAQIDRSTAKRGARDDAATTQQDNRNLVACARGIRVLSLAWFCPAPSCGAKCVLCRVFGDPFADAAKLTAGSC